MKSYTVIITPFAYDSLIKIRHYIAYVLCMPKAALNCINAIESEIKKLEYMATSFAAIQDEPWHTAGIRRIIAKQYYIYYYADEVKGYVYVINIVYSKRNQIRLLEKNSKLFLGYSEN